ncbi:S41 family peptidase [Undibacterium sp. TJN19]|uniref:S41 family peptidase n=1 Tax=Undibacterium sp. TJN19 TaxID=3413055 RepID=UPI003BEFF99E
MQNQKERQLRDLAQLWRDVKWHHPALINGTVDWDKALVSTLPKVQAAQSRQELRDAVAGMMAVLHDPALDISVVDAAQSNELNKIIVPGDQDLLEWLKGDIALLHLHRPDITDSSNAEYAKLMQAKDMIQSRAKGLIIDLRPAKYGWYDTANLDALLAHWITVPLILPTERIRMHSGFTPQKGFNSGGYFSAMQTMEAVSINPDVKAKAIPMVFIINQATVIPNAILALQKTGKAWILAQGKSTPTWFIPTKRQVIAGEVVVEYSNAELIYADGTTGFAADADIAPEPSTAKTNTTIGKAIALLNGKRKPGSTIKYQASPGVAVRTLEPPYRDMRYPELAWRQLAVIKLWAIADTFFPYKHLMDKPWSDFLSVYLKRIENVNNAQEYALTMAEMASNLQDSHVYVRNRISSEYAGKAWLAMTLVMIDKQVVISKIADSRLQQNPDLHVGDIIVKVDGVETSEKLEQIAKTISASNPETKIRDALYGLLAGPEKSVASLLIADHAGKQREIKVPRNMDTVPAPDATPVFKMISKDIAYVNLDRLEKTDINAMFETIKDSKALILDMRGYPRETVWDLAARLNVKQAKVVAQFRRPLVSGFEGDQGGGYYNFEQTIHTQSKDLYRGKLVMLINEETQSAAEHTGLIIESVAPLTYIGTHSAGANGDITGAYLPGALYFAFSGHDVRHADGRQLQRTGLQPDIKIAPSLVGIRAGKDEVLDRAMVFLETGQ